MSQSKKYGVYCFWGSTDRFTIYYVDTIEEAFALIIKKYEKNRNLGGALIYNESGKMLFCADAQKLAEYGDEYRAQMIRNCHEKDEEEENA